MDVAAGAIDASTLPEDGPELAEAAEKYNIFGRVSPEQKKNMVISLKEKGHVVAMTGDGINDALALKHANLGIAMGISLGAVKDAVVNSTAAVAPRRSRTGANRVARVNASTRGHQPWPPRERSDRCCPAGAEEVFFLDVMMRRKDDPVSGPGKTEGKPRRERPAAPPMQAKARFPYT